MSRIAASVSWRSARTRSSTSASTVASRPVVGSSSTSSLRVAGQRHGDDDALLHAAGELVRVALHHPLRVGDAHPAQRVERLLARRRLVVAEDGEGLDDLAADLQRRVQRRARVLVHHRRLAGPEPAQLASDILVTSSPPTRMRPPVITPLAGR